MLCILLLQPRGLPHDTTITVKNLPHTLTWQQLRERFRHVGCVRFAAIKTDSNGFSNGFGVVTFDNAEAARMAVRDMNQTRIAGRQIEVLLGIGGL